MAVHVTRCPHCQTSFRVRDEHLSAARGMVRCGSCLQVFKAAEHFIDGTAVPAAAQPKPTQPKPTQPKPAQTKPATPPAQVTDKEDDDFGLIHDHMDDDPLPEKMSDNPFVDFNLRAPEKQPRPAPRIELELDESIISLRNASSTTLDFVDPDKAAKSPDDDEAWADALLQDDPVDEIAPPPKRPVLNEAEFNFDLPPPEEDDFRGFLDDDDDDEAEAEAEAEAAATRRNKKTTAKNSSFALNGDDELIQQVQEIAIPVRSVPRLQAEPLQLQEQTSNGRRIPWGWLSGIVLMLIIAAAQTLYFRFDDWARTPQWRPFYSQLCAQLECTLPKVQNVRDMSTQHLVVRAHPKLQKALMVDTLLLNRADYEQPFPDLLLVFRDLNDRIVASRRFTPAQYLSGELAGQQDMPVRTPIHIALEIVDPGPEAVSYAIDLLGNQ